MKKQLKPISATYESSSAGDLVYVYIQERNNFKEHPLSQTEADGKVLYDAKNNWNGFEFDYNGETYQVLFNEEKGIASHDTTWLMLDINDLGVFGIESISAAINNLELAEKYLINEHIG